MGALSMEIEEDNNETFISLLKEKKVTWEDIDDFIHEWHESYTKKSIYQYLGMTEYEYALWVVNPKLAMKTIK